MGRPPSMARKIHLENRMSIGESSVLEVNSFGRAALFRVVRVVRGRFSWACLTMRG